MIDYLVNENETVNLYMEFLDEMGEPTIPIEVRWKAEDVMSGTILQDWQLLNVVGNTYVLTIPSDVCSIINNANRIELKRITIKTTLSASAIIMSEINIRVRNLGGVTQ